MQPTISTGFPTIKKIVGDFCFKEEEPKPSSSTETPYDIALREYEFHGKPLPARYAFHATPYFKNKPLRLGKKDIKEHAVSDLAACPLNKKQLALTVVAWMIVVYAVVKIFSQSE